MNKQDFILLFDRMHPNFFKSEEIRGLPEDEIFEEMLLPLDEFDINIYDKKFGDNVSFGLFNGGFSELKKAVGRVDGDWVQFFNEDDRIYCGYIDGKVASFCIIDDKGIFGINGRNIRVGASGCVGTLPEYRDKGIGLTMVKNATQILKDEGFDYGYIHFTYVAKWYEKLGYKTVLRWNRNGVID